MLWEVRESRVLLMGTRPQGEIPDHTLAGQDRHLPLRCFLPTLGHPHECPRRFPICSDSLTTRWVQEPPSPPGSCVHMCAHTHISSFPPKVAEAEFPRSSEKNSGGSMIDKKIGRKRDKTWSFLHTEVRSLRFLSHS